MKMRLVEIVKNLLVVDDDGDANNVVVTEVFDGSGLFKLNKRMRKFSWLMSIVT